MQSCTQTSERNAVLWQACAN